ncbi:hypothetical protein TBLA_0B09640 [Henningerozyma blattae CBS 6284]|uniref:Mitochondrial import inner membrane translocase subunit n=1 Tax=Henningerozyma blattae (strain ATCC 34711 / CBS 6284 / DSM 70876 / NBRC 10599 / NRRL Y-10934 / UCD 77-7) TaxID=1071380 RepID=I2H079_HENB6|nr:hypothetical protein TBLA_0B09640 [Tetrapisispora blattae CBS 6284]CCH59781.1 hypothetical protein TBLA_0B09640 [Tetrapisispora blattae CBS 6284]
MSQSPLSSSTIPLESLSKLDDATKKDMSNFIEIENSKQKMQMSIHQFTNTCFKQCITHVGNDGTLSSQEDLCLRNCLNRFLDTNIQIVKGLQNMK